MSGAIAITDKARKLLDPLDRWACDCHAASVALVRSGEFGDCRVARGSCRGVAGQHSWVVLGKDCYDDSAEIIDPTLWSYVDDVQGVWYGDYEDGLHRPHGKGSIWEWGRPDTPTGEPIELTPRQPFSKEAQAFINLLGPLDEKGWSILAHAPVEDWPSAEIIDALYETGGRFPALIPIDRVGMLTDRIPQYLSPSIEAA